MAAIGAFARYTIPPAIMRGAELILIMALNSIGI
jgi:hypothetical protein